VTESIRNLLVDFEKYYGIEFMGEGEEFTFSDRAFDISLSKYSRLSTEELPDHEGSLDYKMSYYFPLSDALQPTERQ